jgi:hypothetical protein
MERPTTSVGQGASPTQVGIHETLSKW